MDVKTIEKMIDLVAKAKERGVTIILSFVPDNSDVDDKDDTEPFVAVATNAETGEMAHALTQRLQKTKDDDYD